MCSAYWLQVRHHQLPAPPIPAPFTPARSATSRQQHGSQVRDRRQLEVQRLRGVGGGLGENKGLHPMPAVFQAFLSAQQSTCMFAKLCCFGDMLARRDLDGAHSMQAWRHSNEASRVHCISCSIVMCTRSWMSVDHSGCCLANRDSCWSKQSMYCCPRSKPLVYASTAALCPPNYSSL